MCGELWDEPFRRWSCCTTARPNYAPLGPLGPTNYQESIMIPSGIHQSGCEAPIAIPPPSLSSRHAWVGDKLLKRPLCTEVNHTQQYSTDFVALKSARVIISYCIFMYSTPTVRRRKRGWWGGDMEPMPVRIYLGSNYLRFPAYLRGRKAPMVKFSYWTCMNNARQAS